MMPAWRDAVITWPVIHLAFEYLSMGGYSEKLPFLLEPVTLRMLSLIEELKTVVTMGCSKSMKSKGQLALQDEKLQIGCSLRLPAIIRDCLWKKLSGTLTIILMNWREIHH
jgi:hypothetical protein